MPIGYLITTFGVAAAAATAVLRRRPRRASPFRLSYVFGLWLNWPLVALALLAASTALAIAQSGAESPGLWIGLGLALVASAEIVILGRRARQTGPVLERALDEGLGADWRDGVGAKLAARLRRRPSLLHIVVAPITSRRRGVGRIANLRYGQARRSNLLDLYRDRRDRPPRPVLIHFHPLFGSKRFGTRHLFHRLAAQGWLCVAANYSRASSADVHTVIEWVRENGSAHGADPTTIVLAGSSLGSRLATFAACADPSIAGLVCLYGYYGHADGGGTATAPPCLVVHGDQDSLVPVDDARRFVEQLRATSPNAVVYAELPGAQHGFDLFRSRRFDTVVDAVDVFTRHVLGDRAAS